MRRATKRGTGPSTTRCRLLLASAALLVLPATLAGITAGCDGAAIGDGARALPTAPTAASSAATPEPARSEVVVERLDVPGDIPSFVLRGAKGRGRMVFLHGMCGHGQGYVQAFQFAAAEKGTVIALSADIPCDGSADFRKWSADVAAIDRRILAAFRAAGDEQAASAKIVVIGMSQGALRAEALAERFPDRYTHAIFMGAPRPPSPARVRRLRGAVVMSGEFEGTWAMKKGAEALARAGVPATFIPIPKAQHAQLTEGERVMGEALDWLWKRSRESPDPG